MNNYIKGKYKKAIFNSDNGYIIGLFKVKETDQEDVKDYLDKTLTFTGYFADLNENDDYIFYGELINHPRYGYQYQVKEYEKIKPQDKEGIIAFLSSDIFPGIGEKMATRIVEVLGNDAIDKILEDDSCLNLVPKLSYKKAKNLKTILEKHEQSNKIMVYLTDLGFSMQDSLCIYNKYKSNTISNIEHDIFSLIDDIDSINFSKIDNISKKLGVLNDDKRRIKACFTYIMEVLTFKKGDTYLTYEEVKKHLIDYLRININDELLKLYIDELRLERKIVLKDDQLYLKDIFDAEENIINSISKLINKKIKDNKKIDKHIENLEKERQIIYNDKQKEAIKNALNNNILIITGGPGTGKTTIIQAIVEIYREINNLNHDKLINQIALLAPTGRASKKMSESTTLPASTIHRFLKWNKDTNSFGVNEYNKNHHKLIIVDEVSMIDTYLMDALLKGLDNNIQLVLVGDSFQLPSVGAGLILNDLIDSNKFSFCPLSKIYRQSNNSYIPLLAKEIKEHKITENYLSKKDDYNFLISDSKNIRNYIKQVVEKSIEKGLKDKDLQILAPMYKGENGIDNLNLLMQNLFNPKSEDKKEIEINHVIFREKDKVLQLVNNPDCNVFNGDIGYIVSIDTVYNPRKTEIITIDFDGNYVEYKKEDMNSIKHAYAITIHKSQGSEFSHVIIPISKNYNKMLYNKLIYTGVSRAKKSLVLIGEKEAFEMSIYNDYSTFRKTSLKTFLENNL